MLLTSLLICDTDVLDGTNDVFLHLLMLCMFSLVPDLEFCGVDWNSIPYMGKVLLTNISV